MIKKIAYNFTQSTPLQRLFLFAGQGTQEKGMLSLIPESSKNQVLTLAKRVLGLDFGQISTTDEQKIINKTEVTQPLLLISHYLHFRKQNFHSTLSPSDWMIGHSLGQYSALVNAGSISLQQGLKLVHLRGQLMKKHTTVPHGMLIVKFKPPKQTQVKEAIKKANLQIACINTKTSIIVAGKTSDLESAAKTLRSLQAAALTLPVSTAFHCKMLQSMKQQFSSALQKVRFDPPKCKVLRNYDCSAYTTEENIRNGLLQQITSTVLFSESVEKVPLSTEVIEVGHKQWISKFAEEVRRSHFLQNLN